MAVVYNFTKFARDAEAVTVAAVNAALRARGAQEKLVRGSGYYYFTGGDASNWRRTAVYVNNVDALSIQQWVSEWDELRKGGS